MIGFVDWILSTRNNYLLSPIRCVTFVEYFFLYLLILTLSPILNLDLDGILIEIQSAFILLLAGFYRCHFHETMLSVIVLLQYFW